LLLNCLHKSGASVQDLQVASGAASFLGRSAPGPL